VEKLKHIAIILAVCALAVFCMGATLLKENFTGGSTDNEWKAMGTLGTGYEDAYNENIEVVPISDVPGAVVPPGNTSGYVGKIIDADNSYMGISGAYATATAGVTDFIYEAWVYCYGALVNGVNVQGGIAGRISDCEHYVRYFADLGNATTPRLRIDTYTGAWTILTYTGRTETAGWHKMRMRVEADTITIWFDDMNTAVATETMSALGGSVTSGYAGVQVLHLSATPPAGVYYDQILVTDLAGPSTPTPTPTQAGFTAAGSNWTIYE
jgi:hypothetical protein